MVRCTRARELSELHMLVLGTIAHMNADVEDVARRLGVPVALVETVCADLEDAGLLTAAIGH
jgi:DNA-binding MarR family transcriptional regulator